MAKCNEALKQYFEEVTKQWGSEGNSHIKAAHTGFDVDADTRNRKLQALHEEKDYTRIHLHSYSAEELSKHKEAIFLYVDDLNHESVLKIKKTIEGDGHHVVLRHQPTELKNHNGTDLEYGMGIHMSGGLSSTLACTVRDRGGVPHMVTTGHGFKQGETVYSDADRKHKIGTIAALAWQSHLDIATATIEHGVSLCPNKYIKPGLPVDPTALDAEMGDAVWFWGARTGEHTGHVIGLNSWFPETGQLPTVELLLIDIGKSGHADTGDSGAGVFKSKDGKMHLVGLHKTGGGPAGGPYWTMATKARSNLTAMLCPPDNCLIFKH